MSDTTNTTDTRSLHEQVRALFPNAEQVWRYGPDSAEIESPDGGMIRVTDDISPTDDDPEHRIYLIGIYPPDDPDAEAAWYVELPHDPAAVVRYLDDITEQPEGVVWSAWAEQWTDDAIADERLPGAIVLSS